MFQIFPNILNLFLYDSLPDSTVCVAVLFLLMSLTIFILY